MTFVNVEIDFRQYATV